jgi:diguanylate cyclase (GGDEF)-like protein
MRIMVADQDIEHRQRMVAAIQKWGHTVQEALTGREVVELCRKKCPDLIFVDFVLSGETGIEIVRQIRQTGGHAVWVPIIVMGQTISEADMLQCVEAGADDVLVKPITESRLMVKVKSAERHLDLKEEVFKVAHELVVANRALQNVVTQDVLTGIGNSNSFEEILEKDWFKAKQSNLPLSLILLNLDFFQAYNQAYGAEEGDRVIKTVADALKFAAPAGDSYLARTTGETFALILPRTPGQEGLKVAEDLRAAIEKLNIPHKTSGCSDHLTASFGIATAEPGHFTRPWDLKDAADFGLFQAKHYGKNRSYLVPATEEVKSST